MEYELSSTEDYPWAVANSQVTAQVTCNTFTNSPSHDVAGIGSWRPNESQSITHQDVTSVASRVDIEHSMPYIASQLFENTSDPQISSTLNPTVDSATKPQQRDGGFRCECGKTYSMRAEMERHRRLLRHHLSWRNFNGLKSHQKNSNESNAENAQGIGEHCSKSLAKPHPTAEWEHTVSQSDLEGPIKDNHEWLFMTDGETVQGKPSISGLEGNCMQQLHGSRLETDSPNSSETCLGISSQDSFIGRLSETNPTLLPKSSPHTPETGKRQTRNLDHLLNPTAYYEKLNTLELDTARICGLDNGPPDAHSQKDFRDGLQRVNLALKNLQNEEFCGLMMSILVEDPAQPNIARAIHICPQDLDTAGTYYSTRVDEILQEICGDNRSLDNFQSGQGDSRYRFLATTLLVGVVSFSGSHVCPFDVNLWHRSVSEIPVGFGFSFHRRDLACLKDFVGGPAWVLGRSRAKTEAIGMKVFLTVQDLQELWGPVWLVGGTRENGAIIRTERGFVVPLPRHQQSDMTGREVECHWTKTCPQYADALDPIMLSNTSRVLIGTTFGLTINSECQNQISDIQNHFANQLQLPGACNDYYVTEGYDVQLVGGQYVTGGIVGKRKRIPATTLKAALISEILDPELDVTPLLKLNIGLEISPCTGNARRLNLWHTLYLSQKRQIPQLADCKHEVGSIECIERCWKQSCSNRSTSGGRCSDCGVANSTMAPLAAINSKNDHPATISPDQGL